MRVYTDEVPAEVVGGPLDGQVLSVPCGHGVVRLLVQSVAHLYKWSQEDTGAWFLLYEGEVTA